MQHHRKINRDILQRADSSMGSSSVSTDGRFWCHFCGIFLSGDEEFMWHNIKKHKNSSISPVKNASVSLKKEFREVEVSPKNNTSIGRNYQPSFQHYEDDNESMSEGENSCVDSNESVEHNSVPTASFSNGFSHLADQAPIQFISNMSNISAVDPCSSTQLVPYNTQFPNIHIIQQKLQEKLQQKYLSGKPNDLEYLGYGYFLGSQPGVYYFPEMNQVNILPAQQTTDGTFELNATNIISWNEKFKQLCEQLGEANAPSHLLDEMIDVRNKIALNCHKFKGCSYEEKRSIMDAYREITDLIANQLYKLRPSKG